MKFSVKKFVQGSIEEGHAKTKQEAYQALVDNLINSFNEKLIVQKVDLSEGLDNKVVVLINAEQDTAVISFRGKFFTVSFNLELLEAGLDAWTFTYMTDPKWIADMEKENQKSRAAYDRLKKPLSQTPVTEENKKVLKYVTKKEYLN